MRRDFPAPMLTIGCFVIAPQPCAATARRNSPRRFRWLNRSARSRGVSARRISIAAFRQRGLAASRCHALRRRSFPARHRPAPAWLATTVARVASSPHRFGRDGSPSNNMGARAAARQGSVDMPVRLPPSGDDQHGDVNQQAGAKHPHPVLARQPKQVAISNKPIQHDLAYVPEREPRRQCRRRRRHIL
jgi:hypothetical protein